MKTFPLLDFPAETISWSPGFALMSGGPTVSGPGQVGEIGGGAWWRLTLTGVDLGDEARIRQWRALMISASSGVILWVVECMDWPLAPAVGGVPHSDGSTFSDGSLYAGGAIVATLAADAALRATEVQIALDPTTASDLYGGELFTIVHPAKGPRLYLIAEVLDHTDDIWTVVLGVPLREAAASGTEVDFNYLRCVMRLVDPTGEAWPTITAGWSAKIDRVSFEEAFDEIEEG